MGHQVIKQPDGLYAIFSSVVDSWIVYDATRQDVIDYYAEKAAEDARRNAARILDAVDEDPRKAYYQFAMTFEEANAASVEHGGEDLSGKAAPKRTTLTTTDPEPVAGTRVRDSTGEQWVRSGEGDYWLRVGHDYGDPESWVKVAGNYGPVTVLEWGADG